MDVEVYPSELSSFASRKTSQEEKAISTLTERVFRAFTLARPETILESPVIAVDSHMARRVARRLRMSYGLLVELATDPPRPAAVAAFYYHCKVLGQYVYLTQHTGQAEFLPAS